MGKLAAVPVVPVHLAPQSLTDSTTNILVSGGPLLSPLSDPCAQEASPGARTRRDGSVDYQTHSEISRRVSGQIPVPTAPHSLGLSFGRADGLPIQNGIAPDAASLRVPAPALAQSSGLAFYPLAPLASNRPTRAPPPESPPKISPPFWRNPQLATQLRPKPQVKACVLCTGGPGVPVLPDTGLILQSLARVRNIDPDHIITRTSQLIDVALDKFFDPTDISEGAILILIMSCHGFRGCGSNVLLQFKTQEGTTVDSRMLQDKIMALPKHCTLEVVVDTCCAESVIPGLHRISTMDSSTTCLMPAVPDFVTAHAPPSGSHLNTMVPACSASSSAEPSASFPTTGLPKYASTFFEQDPPKYKAQIVWAASTGSGNSFTEENLPERPGVYSILIGAIFNQPRNGPNVSRRSILENVLEVVEQHNDARRERDLRKPPEVRATLIGENRIQRPILLTSVEDPDDVLNGLVFRPIRKGRRTLVDLD
ncbi:hypothetical protein RSAG8_08324, partial [Rhizoctonia solani AG-8 WAC10335]